MKIHYEVEGQGPPLMLQHGITNNLHSWKRNSYVDALKDEYRLILVDARGHGDSSKPQDTQSYSIELMATDNVAVLDDIGIVQACFWEYSMGALIGFFLAQYFADRFPVYILGGGSPFTPSDDEQHSREQMRTALRLGVTQGPDAVAS